MFTGKSVSYQPLNNEFSHSKLVNEKVTNLSLSWRIMIFFLTFSIVANSALEPTIGAIFRHLSPFYFSGIFFFLVMVSTKNSSRKNGSLPGWVMVSFVIFILVALMVFISPSFLLTDGIADASRWAFVFFLIAAMGKLRLPKNVQLIACWGVLAGSLFHGIWLLSLSGWNFLNTTTMVVNIDRNLTGATMLTGIWAGIFIILKSDYSNLKKIIIASLITLLLFWMLLTFSRSALLVLFVTLLVFALFNSKYLKLTIIIGLLIYGGYSVINSITNYSDKLMLYDINSPDAFSEGRISIWTGVLEGLGTTGYLGAGTSNLRTVLAASPIYLSSNYGRFAGPVSSAHNTFLKILADNGIEGAILFIIFFAGMLRFSWNLRTTDIFPLISFVFCLIYCQFFDYLIGPWVLCAVFFAPYLYPQMQKIVINN